MMGAHAADYLELFSTLAIAWQWLELAAAAAERRARGHADAAFIEGKLAAAQYWLATELPRCDHLAHLCRSGESSYVAVSPAAL